MAGLFDSRKDIVFVISDHRDAVVNTHAHVRKSALELCQALECAASRSTRAGDEHTALLGKQEVTRGIASAKPVEECLETLGHIRPVHRTDENDAIGGGELTIDLGKVITDHAGTGLIAGTPAVPAGTAVLDMLTIEMDLFHLDLRLAFQKSGKNLIFRRCG